MVDSAPGSLLSEAVVFLGAVQSFNKPLLADALLPVHGEGGEGPVISCGSLCQASSNVLSFAVERLLNEALFTRPCTYIDVQNASACKNR